jgi:hypothetical protein
MVFQKLVTTEDSLRLMISSVTSVVTSENRMESTIKLYGRHVVLFNAESIGCS